MTGLRLRVVAASRDEASMVRRLMLEAFAEYEGVLEPPSSALDETVDDVLAVMAKGGAVLAWENGDVVGSGRYELREGGVVYIGRLSVPPPFRGRGIAAAMVGFIEETARAGGCTEATLDVRMALPRNLQLYERLGYATVSTYLHPRGNNLVATMRKPLA